MRFLCLHGSGTNSKIFELQTARIRRALGSGYEFTFVDGRIPCPPAAGVEQLASDGDEFLRYVKDDSVEARTSLMADLEAFVKQEGPFDGVMGFSEGASVAAYLIGYGEMLRRQNRPTFFAFQCGIFFSAGDPEDPAGLDDGRVRALEHDAAKLYRLPTAHVWAERDDQYPGSGIALSRLCDEPSLKEEYVHPLGHDVPGAKSDAGVSEAARAIHRTVERTLR